MVFVEVAVDELKDVLQDVDEVIDEEDVIVEPLDVISIDSSNDNKINWMIDLQIIDYANEAKVEINDANDVVQNADEDMKQNEVDANEKTNIANDTV